MTNRTSAQMSIIDGDGEALKLDEAWFAKAVRGRAKLPIELHEQRKFILLDADVISHFKGEGRGWQIQINAAL